MVGRGRGKRCGGFAQSWIPSWNESAQICSLVMLIGTAGSGRMRLFGAGSRGGIALPEHAVGSLGALKHGLVPFEDAATLLYLRGELEGYETRTNVLHVIVDEVQDYGPLQLAALRRAFPKAKFTFVGDALQSLSPFFWENDVICLQDAYAHLGLETVTLTKSYRSTVEIFQFCGAVLGGGPPSRKCAATWKETDSG